MLFDTHAHYDDKSFDEDRSEIILDAYNCNVKGIINVATDISSIKKCISLTEEFDFVYATVGVHPHNVKELDETFLDSIYKYSKNKKVIAIGEIGLDYYHDFSPRDTQKLWFERQIQLAKDVNLPIIVHDRDAHQDVIDIIKSSSANTVGGVLHCYSGSVEMAKIVLDNNLHISIGGPVTFKNSKKLVDVVKYVPIDRLLIETDCPYLTPEPFRGKRNYSGYINFVAEKIAEIKKMTIDEVSNITYQNAKSLFKI